MSDDEQYIPEREIEVARERLAVYLARMVLDTAVNGLTALRDRLPNVERWDTVRVRECPGQLEAEQP
jgi:hypothetical protein